MPFSLNNAPSTFQGIMNEVFRPYLRKFVLVFFDDILVYSRGWDEHLKHLRVVFNLLWSHKFFAKENKCHFGQEEIEYLGHLISSQGVLANPSKIECMLKCPKPTTIKGLRGFLGLTGYYRKFIKDYGKIVGPVTKMLQKDSFHWLEEATTTFQQLKKVMTTPPVLALPDFSKPFLIECDASGRGVGVVLAQGGRPLAYFSQALKGKSMHLSTYEELLALVLAVQKWRPYILGRKFTIKKDQQSLKFL
ncbi:putative mitochondrial protein AtMg00860 [Tasmannia lanceolata]|uniref:putative mitochondrial protein AtMg00860 n=1 Tax=Tasmannia lanceolata TaxID=3420 RepID=UPI0040637ED0